MTKTCSKCSVEYPLAGFYRQKSSPDGYNTQCKLCKRGYEASKYQDPSVRARIREQQVGASLRRRYGITTEQYDSLLQSQNYCCAICERHESVFKTRLAVDHNHISGEVRGLLCNNCNRRLVGRHRDGNLLRKIADYVDQGTGWFVPERKPRKRKKKNGKF